MWTRINPVGFHVHNLKSVVPPLLLPYWFNEIYLRYVENRRLAHALYLNVLINSLSGCEVRILPYYAAVELMPENSIV